MTREEFHHDGQQPGQGRYTFTYDPDGGGNVRIGNGPCDMVVPFAAVQAFVLHRFRQRTMQWVQNADDDTLAGFLGALGVFQDPQPRQLLSLGSAARLLCITLENLKEHVDRGEFVKPVASVHTIVIAPSPDGNHNTLVPYGQPGYDYDAVVKFGIAQGYLVSADRLYG